MWNILYLIDAFDLDPFNAFAKAVSFQPKWMVWPLNETSYIHEDKKIFFEWLF